MRVKILHYLNMAREYLSIIYMYLRLYGESIGFLDGVAVATCLFLNTPFIMLMWIVASVIMFVTGDDLNFSVKDIKLEEFISKKDLKPDQLLAVIKALESSKNISIHNYGILSILRNRHQKETKIGF
jgi:hypothetical protein